MPILKRMIQEEIASHIKPSKVAAVIIVDKLRKRGLLKTEMAEDLERDIEYQLDNQFTIEDDDSNKNFEIDDKYLIASPDSLEDVSLDITDDDIEQFSHRLEKSIETAIPKFIELVSNDLTAAWRESFEAELKRVEKTDTTFLAIHRQVWGKALDELNMLIDLCTFLGSEATFLGKYYKFTALRRLHARSCQVAKEIVVLLRHGFADGAISRWRSLYELMVITSFLHRQDSEVAKRFLEHAEIDDYRLSVKWENLWLNDDVLSKQKRAARYASWESRLKTKYGKFSEKDYLWAQSVFSLNRPVTFTDIEKDVHDNDSLDKRFEFDVKIAHKVTHASAYATLYPIGDHPRRSALLAGASTFGISKPGRVTASLICIITANYLLCRDPLDGSVSVAALIPFRDAVWAAFDAAEKVADATVRADNRVLKGRKRKYWLIG